MVSQASEVTPDVTPDVTLEPESQSNGGAEETSVEGSRQAAASADQFQQTQQNATAESIPPVNAVIEQQTENKEDGNVNGLDQGPGNEESGQPVQGIPGRNVTALTVADADVTNNNTTAQVDAEAAADTSGKQSAPESRTRKTYTRTRMQTRKVGLHKPKKI